MPVTVTIPLTTLTVGGHDFGPATAPDGDSLITINIDRTVVNGLNAQPATTQITLESFQSNDGGVTWQNLAVNTVTGGLLPAKGGGSVLTDQLGTTLNPGTGRRVRATVTVAGSGVAVAGSLVTQ